MNRLTQPLRDEHAELRPEVEALARLGDAAGEVPSDELARRLTATSAFLRDHLLVHARAEEAVLYPAVEEAMGRPGVTATMIRDHAEIVQLIRELGEIDAAGRAGHWSGEDLRRLRRVLYGLYAILVLHFAKEEEIYLPLLDGQLTPESAARLFTALEQAAAAAR
jgi:iron-sulfur cluster repair protein YtfE (RIC family)